MAAAAVAAVRPTLLALGQTTHIGGRTTLGFGRYDLFAPTL